MTMQCGLSWFRIVWLTRGLRIENPDSVPKWGLRISSSMALNVYSHAAFCRFVVLGGLFPFLPCSSCMGRHDGFVLFRWGLWLLQ